MKFCALLCTLLLKFNLIKFCFAYTIDDSVGSGRIFDGIGGLSGGGVSTCNPALYTWIMDTIIRRPAIFR